MPKLFVTHHGAKRIAERFEGWNDKRHAYGLAKKAWYKGRLPNDKELERLFIYGSKRTSSFMLDYRIYEDYVFVFDTREPGKIRFVTIFPNELTQTKSRR